MEETQNCTGFRSSNSSTESSINGQPRSASKRIERTSATILVEAISDDINYAGTVLSSESRVFEGLTYMHFAQGPPRTATLVYSAAVFAEAMLYRSARRLKKDYGMRLSLVPYRQEEAPSIPPAAVEHPTVMSQTLMPGNDASQPSAATPGFVREAPPAIVTLREISPVAHTRPNEPENPARPSSEVLQLPPVRFHEPSTPASLVPRLNEHNANVSLTPVNTTPHDTPTALYPATMSSTLRPTPANSATSKTGLRSMLTNPTLDRAISATASSMPSANAHSSSTQVNSPSNVHSLASSPAITNTVRSSTDVKTGMTLADTRSSLPFTKAQQRYLLTGIQNLSKRKVALLFAQPVSRKQVEMMGIPTYFDVITKPMDLRTMEERLRNASYRNINEYVADFAQMVENTVRFNGPDHEVTQEAYELKKTFERQIRHACQSFSPVAEKATPIPKNGRPRKFRKVDEEVMELMKRIYLAAVIADIDPSVGVQVGMGDAA